MMPLDTRRGPDDADCDTMFRTCEIRWFFPTAPPDRLLDWSEAADASPTRVDWYATPSNPRCGIKIREGKPFVMDFAKQPTVVFTGPTKGRVYRPGDKISIKALMLETELGMMIRGLYDTTRKTGSRSATNEQGESVSVPRYASLHPTVSITDSSGKEVASGTMPFG